MLTTDFLWSSEVGRTISLDSNFVILDMNGIVLGKKPLVTSHKHVYLFKEDVGEFLEFSMKSFEVVFGSCCN